jgi:hypothetical protein
METFEVKQGLMKSIGGNAGLAKMATRYFDDVQVDGDGIFTANFAILKHVECGFNEKGKLVVEVEQMKGLDLGDFLENDGGREKAMESRKRWSSFLDAATGYNPKQRGDKAKEAGKKLSKAKSSVAMARKLMLISEKMSAETKAEAEVFIAEIEAKLEEGDGTRAASLSVKLNKLLSP